LIYSPGGNKLIYCFQTNITNPLKKLTKLAEGKVVCFQGLKLAVFEFVLRGFETKTNFLARKHMF